MQVLDCLEIAIRIKVGILYACMFFEQKFLLQPNRIDTWYVFGFNMANNIAGYACAFYFVN